MFVRPANPCPSLTCLTTSFEFLTKRTTSPSTSTCTMQSTVHVRLGNAYHDLAAEVWPQPLTSLSLRTYLIMAAETQSSSTSSRRRLQLDPVRPPVGTCSRAYRCFYVASCDATFFRYILNLSLQASIVKLTYHGRDTARNGSQAEARVASRSLRRIGQRR